MTARDARSVSRAFDALGWAFTVSSDHAPLVEHVTTLYAGLGVGAPGGDVHSYRIERVARDDYALDLDGEALGTGDDPSRFVATIVHDVNQHAIETTPLLAAHAGGVVGARGAVVMPAHMEAGKTTLTAGLVRAGFGYLSDEAVAFDWDTLDITAYAKPLSIDPGAWELFPQLEPHAAIGGEGYKASQWQVPPDAVRPGAVVPTARARHVVFPQYVPGADTRLVAIGGAEAVVELAKNTFHFSSHGRRALDALARLVTSVECHRLTVGDLEAAVATISDLAGVPA